MTKNTNLQQPLGVLIQTCAHDSSFGTVTIHNNVTEICDVACASIICILNRYRVQFVASIVRCLIVVVIDDALNNGYMTVKWGIVRVRDLNSSLCIYQRTDCQSYNGIAALGMVDIVRSRIASHQEVRPLGLVLRPICMASGPLQAGNALLAANTYSYSAQLETQVMNHIFSISNHY